MRYELNNKKVLVLKLQGLGDTVLLLPMLKKILTDYPSVKLDCAVNANGSEELLELTGLPVRKIYNVKQKISGYLSFLSQILIRHYDLIILPYKSGKKENLLSFLSCCRKRIGFSFKNVFYKYYFTLFDFLINIPLPVKWNEHYIIKNLRLAEFLSGIKYQIKNYSEIIQFTFLHRNKTDAFIKKNKLHSYLVFHLGAGDKDRLWHINNYIELIKKILVRYKKYKIVLVGKGRIESQLNHKVLSAVSDKRIMIFNNNSLENIMLILQNAEMTIGNDSGIMHLASLFSNKILSIQSYANYKHTAPAGNGVYVIRRKLDCSPCYTVKFPVKCRYSEKKCLSEISLNQVWMFFNKILLKKKIQARMLPVRSKIIDL